MPPAKKSSVSVSSKAKSGRFQSLSPEKLRGGYYTSEEIARWVCEWAIEDPENQVLEPSCGNGAFLQAAAMRLLEIGAKKTHASAQITAIEIIPEEAEAARKTLKGILTSSAEDAVVTSDFFSWREKHPQNLYDVVVGNPPFIRYQTFPEPHRTLAMGMLADQGLKPNRLTNIWVPFVVAATAALRPGGKLGLVLPAEILQVTYAAQLRSFLTDRFMRLDIVACNELFFEKAEQEVVLLLADGRLQQASEANPCRVAMTETKTVKELVNRRPKSVLANAEPKTIKRDSEKWLKYFLSQREIEFMRELRSSSVTTSLATHASVDVGVVTGRNDFFVLTSEQVRDLGVEGFTAPLVSRSVHLRGARVDMSDWQAMADAGDKVHLLDLKNLAERKLPAVLKRYIRFGEEQEVHTGYKCSIRTPWYAVPSVWVPDGFLFRQIYDFPRVVLNGARATSTDTIHRFTAKSESAERIIANTYSWLTAASAEIEGRSYGGGVLELEPTEAERLLMPAKLNGALPLEECDRLTRAGRIDDVLQENGRIVLMKHMGLSKTETILLRDIWVKMRDRRLSRRKSSRASTLRDTNA